LEGTAVGYLVQPSDVWWLPCTKGIALALPKLRRSPSGVTLALGFPWGNSKESQSSAFSHSLDLKYIMT